MTSDTRKFIGIKASRLGHKAFAGILPGTKLPVSKGIY